MLPWGKFVHLSSIWMVILTILRHISPNIPLKFLQCASLFTLPDTGPMKNVNSPTLSGMAHTASSKWMSFLHPQPLQCSAVFKSPWSKRFTTYMHRRMRFTSPQVRSPSVSNSSPLFSCSGFISPSDRKQHVWMLNSSRTQYVPSDWLNVHIIIGIAS